MPLVLEQPNLDVPEETHLYFDAGDSRLITFFVREDRQTDPTPTSEAPGTVSSAAEINPPDADSATATVSPRARSRSAMASAVAVRASGSIGQLCPHCAGR